MKYVRAWGVLENLR